MALKTIGTIAIPGSAVSSFDHGAFDPATRRIFVAHTGRMPYAIKAAVLLSRPHRRHVVSFIRRGIDVDGQ